MIARCALLLAVSQALGCIAPVADEDAAGQSLGISDGAGYAVGISDSDAATFSHPAWAGSNIRRARAVAPYDVAERPATDGRRRSFEAWLDAARAHRVEPFVTLYLSRNVTTPSGQFLAPDAREYERAFRTFRRTYPSVRIIAPWNEPNFREHGLRTPNGRRAFYEETCPVRTVPACGPLAAATYYRIARRVCPRCTIVAGEFAASNFAYVREYKRYLYRHRPKVWGIHPYTDVNRFQQSGDRRAAFTRRFLRELRGSWSRSDDGSRSHLWLTEVGAYYRRPCEGNRACARGRVEPCEGERCRVFGNCSQARAARFLMGIPEISSRITRIYYYNFQNGCGPGGSCPVQDRGLVAPIRPGEPLGYDRADRIRTAYDVVATRGGRLPPRDRRGMEDRRCRRARASSASGPCGAAASCTDDLGLERCEGTVGWLSCPSGELQMCTCTASGFARCDTCR